MRALMKNSTLLRLYRMRLKIAGVQNILEMIQAVSGIIDAGRLERARPAMQMPFRHLLFALSVRCGRLLEDIDMQLDASQPSRRIREGELAEIREFVSAKRKEISQAQALLEKGSLNAAFHRLAKSKEGIKELAERMDGLIESRLQ